MSTPKQPGAMARLVESGEIYRLAVGCRNAKELAARCGLNEDSMIAQLQRLRAKGVNVPKVADILIIANGAGRDRFPVQDAANDRFSVDVPGQENSPGPESDEWDVEKTSPDLAPLIEANRASERNDNVQVRGVKVPDIQKVDNAHEPSTGVNVRGAIPFGTPMQRASAEAFIRLGSVEAAAAEMQLTPEQLRAHLSELERRAAARGWAPGNDMTRTAPQGYSVKGVSTLYGADGEVRGQWVKTKRDEEQRLTDLLAAVQTIAEPFRGAADPVATPSLTDDDLLCVYPFGDPHFGLYSWAQETGEDFDLDIAERVTVGAIDHLVRVAPSARQALILSVGDTFHADSYDNKTQSGHPLDVDTRWSKVLTVTVRAYRRCIDRALEKHQEVLVWIVPGNHDPHSSIVLGVCLAQYYEREPRVTVDTSPGRFRWMRFGQNLLGATHGDKARPAQMAAVMACDRAKDWGETRHRRIYSGHLHHDRTEEFPGVTVDTLRTLAAKDAWHAASGYRSGRDMKCDVYHREHGLISRHVVNVHQLLEQAA